MYSAPTTLFKTIYTHKIFEKVTDDYRDFSVLPLNYRRRSARLRFELRTTQLTIEVTVIYNAPQNSKTLNMLMIDSISKCLNCGDPLIGMKRKYCSIRCKNTVTNKYFQCYENQKDRARTRKLKLIEPFGSKCSICGYGKNLAALHLHHLNPTTKSFTLSQRELANRSPDAVVEETKKCILLCSNCHMELHHPADMVAEDGIAPSEVRL